MLSGDGTVKELVIESEADLFAWGVYMRTASLQVDHAEVGESKVDTSFVGLYLGLSGPPIWFKSLVSGGKLDGLCREARTYSEALEMHIKVVDLVKYVEPVG